MPIEPIIGAGPIEGGARVKRRQTGFALPDAGAPAETDAPPEAPASMAPNLLTLQATGMADAEAASDRDAARQGESLLGAMRGLQLAMLGGGGAADHLAGLAEAMPDASDPGLNAVLRAIAQRAAVERARRS